MERNNTHLAGEYFVAAELYRRGYSVGMTIGNAKAIDMFANKDTRTVSVQVKAIKDQKSVGWPIMKDKILNDVIYIFVNLNGQGQPHYYIATAAEAVNVVNQYAARGIITLSSLNNEQYHNRWDKMEEWLA